MDPAASPLMVGMSLHSSSTNYALLEFIGQGGFGKVAKCLDLNSREVVAVKVLNKEFSEEIEDELAVLNIIGQLNSDQSNMVTFYESFQHLDYTCLVFERLDKDLFHHLRDQKVGMYVNQIRPIAKQLLVALESLRCVGIIHTDIKPDNIMLVDEKELPFKVKLIDFGLALHCADAQPGDQVQTLGYRAPEVSLGLPYSEAIDMWGLGCSLAFLYLRGIFFPVHCEYFTMKVMVKMLGMPSDQQLQCGKNTQQFFCKEEDQCGSRWRLLTPEEYTEVNHIKPREWHKKQSWLTSLDDLVHLFAETEAAEMKDREVFVDFLKRMLDLDGETRISPTAALEHPFITMSHLSQDPGSRDYFINAQDTMNITSLGYFGDDFETEVSESSDEGVLPIWSSTQKHGKIEETYFPQQLNATIDLSSSTENNGNAEEANVPKNWGIQTQHSPATCIHSGILSPPYSSLCDKDVDAVPSFGFMTVDLSIPAFQSSNFSGRKRKTVREFFSRLRTKLFGCCSSSVMD